MILHYERLQRYPTVFKSLTGLRVAQFDDLVADVLPRSAAAEQARRTRPTRQRAMGAGHPCALTPRTHILLTVVWLRVYPIHAVLAYLVGLSDPSVGRVIARVLPVVEARGRDTMRLPDPGRKHRRTLDGLLAATPELAVVIDPFAQPVQRQQDPTEADRYDSGKQKRHTLKSQVAVDAETGQIVAVAKRVPGPTAAINRLAQSSLLERLPDGRGGSGDVAYVGIDTLHPPGLGATPRRKPRGKARPPDDSCYNRAFARRRIVVEHRIGRLRRYQSLPQLDRQHRRQHTARVRAVAGLVNRQRRVACVR